MHTQPLARTARTARLVVVAVALALLATLVSLSTAHPASAAVAQSVSGRTGSVSLNGPLITGRDIMYPTYYIRTFETAGVTVAPSSAYSGTQTVLGGYVLERYVNGAWRTVQSTGSYSGNVSGTGRLRFPAVTFGNAPQYTGQFPYRIAVALVWTKASTGAVIGSERIISSTTSDNRCATRMIRCLTYTDSIVM